MRILYASKGYHPLIGGVETVVRQLAEGVAAVGEAEVLVCHHEAFAPLARETIGGVEVVRVPTLGTRFSTPLAPTYPLHFARAIDEADLVHLQIPFPIGEAAVALLERRLADKPLVITFHADPGLSRWRALLSLYRPLLSRTLARADRIVVTAPANLESAPSLAGHREKVRVIPLAPDEHFPSVDVARRAAELRRELHLEGERVVLFFGRLSYYKGVDVLVRAMVGVPEATLVVAGDGELAEVLRGMVRRRGLEARVRFAGRVPEADVAAYFALADVFAFPSVGASEAFGIAQLDALRAGVPVVNTALETGVPFVSPHGVTGLTVPPGDAWALADALRTILRDDSLRARFSENARARAAEFTLERMRAAYLELYAELLARR